MEFRKMATITLCTRQQKRHWCIEQSYGLCVRGRGWGELGEWHWNMYNIIYEMSRQSRFDARYWMLGAGALGRPRGMVWGGRREEGSGWGTHVCLWGIHFDIWQNQYNIVKFKNKIKFKKNCIILKTNNLFSCVSSANPEFPLHPLVGSKQGASIWMRILIKLDIYTVSKIPIQPLQMNYFQSNLLYKLWSKDKI